MANRRFRQICKAALMTNRHSNDILVGVRNDRGFIDCYLIPDSAYDAFRREYRDRIIDWMTTQMEVYATYGEDS